jgi:hypothetical protein
MVDDCSGAIAGEGTSRPHGTVYEGGDREDDHDGEW